MTERNGFMIVYDPRMIDDVVREDLRTQDAVRVGQNDRAGLILEFQKTA